MINKMTPKTWKNLYIAAAVSLVIFIVLQFLPSLNATANTTGQSSKPISKEHAIQLASNFAEELTGLSVEKGKAYHQANKIYTGYISKNNLIKEHEQKIEQLVPFDQYQVNLRFERSEGQGYVIMNLFTGQITGWDFNLPGIDASEEETMLALKNVLLEKQFPVDDNTHFDQYESLNSETSIFEMSDTRHHGWYISNDSEVIGEAIVQIDTHVSILNDQVIVDRYFPDFIIPDQYIEMTSKQDFIATIWTYAGYMGFTFIFGILAIIYAILYRKHTSFKYGLWLTVISTIISLLVNFGMMDAQIGLSSNTVNDGLIMNMFMYFFVVVSVLFGAVGVYFSFVAGDGLWKAQGFNLWPRFKEDHYGQHVWDAMKLGYLFAIILLGIQNVIYLLLTTALGTWSANDTSQSFINFEYSWIYPAIAWFAAITEEVIYRYFGVGIFRRWFKNTFLAALIPSLVWAAGHTLYPLYPASTRILELLIIGILFTYIMVKFGFITGMFTHAIFNTILMGMQLFIYGNSLDMVSSVVFFILPIIIAAVIRWLHGKRKKDTGGQINYPQYPHDYPHVTGQE